MCVVILVGLLLSWAHNCSTSLQSGSPSLISILRCPYYRFLCKEDSRRAVTIIGLLQFLFNSIQLTDHIRLASSTRVKSFGHFISSYYSSFCKCCKLGRNLITGLCVVNEHHVLCFVTLFILENWKKKKKRWGRNKISEPKKWGVKKLKVACFQLLFAYFVVTAWIPPELPRF